MSPEILDYWHCAKCLEEIPNDISPRDYSQLEIGPTAEGIQVWCRRHDLNVIHIDFEGHKHPAIASVRIQ